MYNTCRVLVKFVPVLLVGSTQLQVTGVGAVNVEAFETCRSCSSGLAMGLALSKLVGAAIY